MQGGLTVAGMDLERAAGDPWGRGFLVAGLGNYGLRGTRHSVGMAILNHLASKLSVADQWRKDRRCCADVALATLGETELVLMKPRRLMNINGLSVLGAVEAYGLDIENIYLVHDDLDKPLGKVALKLGGSARYTILWREGLVFVRCWWGASLLSERGRCTAKQRKHEPCYSCRPSVRFSGMQPSKMQG
uniref:Peptidyl-tRNA hydrolase 1 homolog n=1 Tax=Varanus komodoensis TaxID=61221 RepID=A0A8D2Q8N5_VARKO